MLLKNHQSTFIILIVLLLAGTSFVVFAYSPNLCRPNCLEGTVLVKNKCRLPTLCKHCARGYEPVIEWGDPNFGRCTKKVDSINCFQGGPRPNCPMSQRVRWDSESCQFVCANHAVGFQLPNAPALPHSTAADCRACGSGSKLIYIPDRGRICIKK